ncbi:hypothetical protein TSAR_009222 [Trichomalopsis sarcophagae]|uniref:Uncharacterized protein n=1 Tax=Trichomalopsis sarcophagae TaxID=543379 RepID=A0A232FEB2_9HYME|nr:hypothetical protein TSAR_009222 [Trichomalopsis sarcophagae]
MSQTLTYLLLLVVLIACMANSAVAWGCTSNSECGSCSCTGGYCVCPDRIV